jgi:hypothetical protein
MCVKVGVTEDVGAQTTEGGATLAQIASWNELGVLGPPMSQHGSGLWFIPPRPFVRGWADGKREQIAKTHEKLYGLVMGGKLKAEEAVRRLGEFGQSGVKSYIKHGSFTPNSDVTINGSKPGKNGKKFIKGKGSSKPLIDTGTLRNSIRYQVIEKPVAMVSE